MAICTKEVNIDSPYNLVFIFIEKKVYYTFFEKVPYTYYTKVSYYKYM